MCTALSLSMGGHYFGRNLDLDRSYGEQVCVLPRHFPLEFRRMGQNGDHYAIIGMALVMAGTPLFYDGANERGLCMAGLNFPRSARYFPEKSENDNVAPFELIPWVLCQCATVREARTLLEKANLADIPFSAQVPLSPLHWMVSDGEESLVVESTAEGLRLYENPVGVLTNEPEFPYQIFQINNLRGLSAGTPENTLDPKLPLSVYCQGLGGLGLPGDVSSMSRFQRMAFHALNSAMEPGNDPVSQFFHLLGSVEMVRGACRTDEGHWDITVYSSCIEAKTGRYYYTTYENRQISCVDLRKEDLDGDALRVFPVRGKPSVFFQN